MKALIVAQSQAQGRRQSSLPPADQDKRPGLRVHVWGRRETLTFENVMLCGAAFVGLSPEA